MTVLAGDGLIDASAVQEGARMTVLANARDDVQVSRVVFLVDDMDSVLEHTDASFPFTFNMVAPSRTSYRSNVRVTARVVDTAGNALESTVRVVSLLPDITVPAIIQTVPHNDYLYQGVVRASVSGEKKKRKERKKERERRRRRRRRRRRIRIRAGGKEQESPKQEQRRREGRERERESERKAKGYQRQGALENQIKAGSGQDFILVLC